MPVAIADVAAVAGAGCLVGSGRGLRPPHCAWEQDRPNPCTEVSNSLQCDTGIVQLHLKVNLFTICK